VCCNCRRGILSITDERKVYGAAGDEKREEGQRRSELISRNHRGSTSPWTQYGTQERSRRKGKSSSQSRQVVSLSMSI
jgi:hypothetical protein